MLRILIALSLIGAIRFAHARARPDHAPLDFAERDGLSEAGQPRHASPWLPTQSQLRTGESAILALIDLYNKRFMRNQPGRYRATQEEKKFPVTNSDKIIISPISDDLAGSGVHYSPRLPASSIATRDESGINFEIDDLRDSRLPMGSHLSSRLTNVPAISQNATVSAPKSQGQQISCVQSGPSFYCEEDNDYPEVAIRSLLSTEANALNKYFSQAEIQPFSAPPKISHKKPTATVTMPAEESAIHTRVKPSSSMVDNPIESVEQDYSLCAAMRMETFPKGAKNTKGDMVTVVNQDNIRQSITIEKCSRPDGQCRHAQSFPAGFKAVCKQRYTQHRLTVYRNNEFVPDTFLFPSCCVCEVKPIGINEGIKPNVFTNDEISPPVA